jgi:hypothetical protein
MIANHNEHAPGTPAPETGRYEELNVLGTATGVVVERDQGEMLPSLPRGFTWRQVPRSRLSDLGAADLMARAAEYRQMAATARMLEVRDALLKLAQRFEDAAHGRQLPSD